MMPSGHSGASMPHSRRQRSRHSSSSDSRLRHPRLTHAATPQSLPDRWLHAPGDKAAAKSQKATTPRIEAQKDLTQATSDKT